MKHELVAGDSAGELEPVQEAVATFDIGQRSLGGRWVVVICRDGQRIRVLRSDWINGAVRGERAVWISDRNVGLLSDGIWNDAADRVVANDAIVDLACERERRFDRKAIRRVDVNVRPAARAVLG